MVFTKALFNKYSFVTKLTNFIQCKKQSDVIRLDLNREKYLFFTHLYYFLELDIFLTILITVLNIVFVNILCAINGITLISIDINTVSISEQKLLVILTNSNSEQQ